MSSNKRLKKWLLVAALALAQPPFALAQQIGVVKFFGADMRAEPNLKSPVVLSIPAGEKTEYIQNDGPFWWKVKWNNNEGWVLRALLEKFKPGEEVPASMLGARSSDGAGAPYRVPIEVPLPPGQGKAVIFGISDYDKKSGITSLPGVPVDMGSATAMAQMMGISKDQVTVYRDASLNKEAMVSVLTQLAKDLKPEEPVLIYYSGHGGRTDDPTSPGRCIEGLITHEGGLITSTEMASLLQPIAKQTDNLFVFFDACHSGGLSTTRALQQAGDLRPKFFSKSTASNCSEIVNILSTPGAETRSTGKRFIYAAAARQNEVSLDDARTGGLATSSWLRCMASADNTSSVEDLRRCAQASIEQRLEGNRQFKPQNMTITGDLAQKTMRANFSSELKQQLVQVASQGGEGVQSAKSFGYARELTQARWPVPYNIAQSLKAVSEKSAKTGVLKVEMDSSIRINGSPLRAKVTPPHDGFLYLFFASADGKGLTMLFPNAQDKNNRVEGNKPFMLPRENWPLVSGGPAGNSKVLFVFSEYERDLTALIGQLADPFFDVAVSPLGVQAFSLAMSRSVYATDVECDSASKGKPAWCKPDFLAVQKTLLERP